jgi:DNA-binding MarR family transcriptional regulator
VTTRDDAVEIQRLVFRAFALFKKGPDARFRARGLTGAQVGVLTRLRAGEGRPMGALGAELWCDVSNITGIVARLEERGLVRRSADAEDQRVKRVHLTERGREALARVLPEHEAALAADVRRLTAAERSTVIALLKKLVADEREESR